MSKTGPLPDDDPRKVVQEATIRTLESKDYRSIHVNGSVGGYNQFGEIYLGLFSERAANAETARFQLLDDGTTNVVPDVGPNSTGIIRELQVGVFMSPAAAQNLVGLLVTTLNDLREAAEDQREEAARRESANQRENEKGDQE